MSSAVRRFCVGSKALIAKAKKATPAQSRIPKQASSSSTTTAASPQSTQRHAAAMADHSAEPRRPVRKMCFCDQHTVNRIVAKIIPVLLVGAAGFATWVYIAQICGISSLA